LGEELQRTPLQEPQFPVICNVDATPVKEPDAIRTSLQDQVTGTVCWTETIEYLVDEDQGELVIELGPGVDLAALLNPICNGAPCVALTEVGTVEAAWPVIRAA